MKLSLAHKGLMIVSAILAVELSFLGCLYYFLLQTEEAALRSNDAKKIMGSTNQVWTRVFQCLSKAAYVSQHYDDKESVRQFLHSCAPAYAAMHKLKDLLDKEGAGAYPKLRAVLATGRKAIKSLELVNKKLENGDLAGAQMVSVGLERRGMAMHILHYNLTNESRLARLEQLEMLSKSPALETQIKTSIKWLLVLGIIANIIMAVMVCLLFSRGITARLKLVVENTARLIEGRPLNPALKDHDEIAHLDRVFHEMAETLAESARKERAVIENARDVICALDRQGLFLSLSPASAQVWGYQAPELLGKPAGELLVDQASQKSWCADLEYARQQGVFSLENRLLRKDGAIADMLWSLRWKEEEERYFCIAHDITERKKQEEILRASEARVRSMFDNMQVGLLTVTESGVIEFANSRAEQMFKFGQGKMKDLPLLALIPDATTGDAAYQDQEQSATVLQPRGKSTVWSDAAQPSGDCSQKAALLRSSWAAAMQHAVDLQAQSADGQILPVELSLTRFLSVRGERFLVNLLDVTERHELEKMKQEFIAMISHDLRTPLASVQGYLDLLADGTYGQLPEEAGEAARQSLRHVVWLLRLVNDLLDMAKLESGKLELQFENVCLGDLVERSFEDLRPVAEKAQVGLEFSGTETVVRADSDRLQRVFGKLLLNAIKSSPCGGSVRISVEDFDGDALVKVEDRGLSIPAGQKDLLFERFQKVEGEKPLQEDPSKLASQTRDRLGLAICKAIIEKHGGAIGVTSHTGSGNTFWFRIPGAGTDAGTT